MVVNSFRLLYRMHVCLCYCQDILRQDRITTGSYCSFVGVRAHDSGILWAGGPDILAQCTLRSVLLHFRACLKIPFHGPFGPRQSDAVGFGRCSSHTFATVLLVQFISYYYSLFGSCDDKLVTRHRTFL